MKQAELSGACDLSWDTLSTLISADSAVRSLLDTLPIGVYVCDADGLLLYYNRQAARLWGFEPSCNNPAFRYCGSLRLHSTNGHSIPHDECWMALALRTGEEFSGNEIVIEKPDGKFSTVSTYLRVIRNGNGQVLGAMNLVVDITAKKRAEHELRRSKNILEDFFENSVVGLHFVAEDGTILRVNRAELEMLGYTRDEYVGHNIAEFHLDKPHVKHILRRLSDGEEIGNVESEVRCKDGSTRHVLVSANVLREDGRFIHTRCFMLDITDVKNAQEALINNENRLREVNLSLEQKVRERTSKLIAHQSRLRLLASKLTMTEQRERSRIATELHDNLAQLLAVCKMKLAAMQAASAGTADTRGLQDISTVIDDALRYTRTLVSDLSPPFDLRQNDLRNATGWVAGKMKQHGLDVSVHDDGGEMPVEPGHLITLFESTRELLFNVIRHSGVDSATVTLRRNDDSVAVIVSDNGQGFDASTGLEPDIDRGFGLFSIRERLAAIGGTFEIESVPGRGTTVTLTVPVAASRAEERTLISNGQPGATGRTPAVEEDADAARIRVLLADDHVMMREGLRSILKANSEVVVVGEAADGEKAVELAHRLQPDIVVMDVSMPQMNGLEATKKIVSSLPSVKVIALSMNEDEGTIAAMREAGAVDYLFKSHAFDTLSSAIQKHACAFA